MRQLNFFSRLIITMLVVCALGTSCENDTDDVNVTQPSFTVTFESNGGTVIADVTTDDGLINEPTDPELDGCAFVGWYSDELLDTKFNFGSTITGDVTLYAKWSANSYTVSFVTYEGDVENNIPDQTVDYGALVSEPDPKPTRMGYAFRGWYIEAETIDLWYFTSYKVGSADMTLYAKWLIDGYSVAYYSSIDNDYTTLPEIYCDYAIKYDDQVVDEATEPVATGYKFVGWYDNAELSGDEYVFGDNATGDVLLYAKWEINVYNVTFETGSSDVVETQVVEYGLTAEEPTTDPTNGNLTFIGWYSDEACQTKYDFDAAVTSNVTIYARWSNIVGIAYFYSVAGHSEYSDYTTELGDAATELIESGMTVTEPDPVPTDIKYDFVGWYTEEGIASDVKYNFAAEVTSDVVLYAKWKIKTFTVTFDTGTGGSAVDTQMIEYGGKVEEPTTEPTNSVSNMQFDGWYTDASCKNLFDFDDTDITYTTTIYAKWLDVVGEVKYYNVVGNADVASYGASPEVISTVPIERDATIAVPYVATDDNDVYEFDCWCTSDGTPYGFDDVITEGGDVELYGIWKYKSFTVTFNVDGGSLDTTTQLVEYNQYATDPGIPTKTKALFQGWYYNSVEFDFDATQITSDITIVAKWLEVDADYVIYNETDLAAFRDAVNLGTAVSASAMLADDVTLTEPDWTPIGSSSKPFAGTFDGYNHTVSGLVINATGTSANYKGFFGCINGGTIKNITLFEPKVVSSHSGASGFIGALIGGFANNAVTQYIENCTVSGGYVTVSSGGYVGGIVGATYGKPTIYMTNCTNDGTAITGGGVYVGGIVGQSNNAESIFKNCRNSGAVTNASTQTGGIIGYGNADLTVIGCSNTGIISSTGEYVGGILGGSAKAPSLIGCYNTGSISASDTAGGITGNTTSTVALYSCYNTGSVTVTSDEGTAAGALFGSVPSGAMAYNSYYISVDGDGVVAAGSDSRSDTSGSTAVASIEALNGVVGTMNANTTFSVTDYYYVAGDSTTPPTLVVK